MLVYFHRNTFSLNMDSCLFRVCCFLIGLLAHISCREKADALHLVEHRVVASIDFIAAVDVTNDQEGVLTRPHALDLVRTCVRSQHVRAVDLFGTQNK